MKQKMSNKRMEEDKKKLKKTEKYDPLRFSLTSCSPEQAFDGGFHIDLCKFAGAVDIIITYLNLVMKSHWEYLY